MKIGKAKKFIDFNLGGLLVLLLAIVFCFPLLYAFLTSFMTGAEMTTYPPSLIPNSFTNLENYKEVFIRFPVFRYMLNSLILGVTATAVRIITGLTAAFAFAFYEFKGKKVLFMLALGTMMIPFDSIIIANYRTVTSLKLIDSYLGLMIIYFVSANYMFIMRQHMMTLPKELHDAALIDGCSSMSFFVRIIVPCAQSVIVAVGISSFVALWNVYFWPLLVTNTDNMRTIQLGLKNLHTEDAIEYTAAMAGVCLVLIPSVLVFAIFQKKIVRGITQGAVKG